MFTSYILISYNDHKSISLCTNMNPDHRVSQISSETAIQSETQSNVQYTLITLITY